MALVALGLAPGTAPELSVWGFHGGSSSADEAEPFFFPAFHTLGVPSGRPQLQVPDVQSETGLAG